MQKPSAYLAIRDHGVRTYGDLIRVARSSGCYGTCCACHQYGVEVWQLSTRASICEACCIRKTDEVLGSIATAERAARRHVRNAIKEGEDVTKNLKFYAYLTGASQEFIAETYRAALAKA